MVVATLVPFTLQWYVGAVPPYVGTGVKLTVVPVHTVSFGVAVSNSDGVTVGIVPTEALPVILILQVVAVLVAITVYTPLTVCSPKSRGEPVPAKVPVAVMPRYNI